MTGKACWVGALLLAGTSFAEGGRLDVPGGTITWERAGRGAPVVLLHDGLLPMASWDDVLPDLSARFDVIRWDRRGYGASTTTTRDFAHDEDLLALLDHLKLPRVALVGSSSGGALALDFAILHPGRAGALVLEGPVLSGFSYSAHFSSRGARNAAPVRLAGDEAATLRRWGEDSYLTDARNRGARQHLLALLQKYPEAATNKIARSLRPELDTRSRLGEIQVPVRIVVGEADIPDVHAHVGAIASGIQGAERIVAERAGHLLHLERPERFASLVHEFLDPDSAARELLDAGLGRPATAADRAAFAYDTRARLELAQKKEEGADSASVGDVSFRSPNGSRASALLVEPARAERRGEKRAGLVFLHHGQGDRGTFLEEAKALAERGVVSVLLEAPQNRPDAATSVFDPGDDRKEIVQTVVELRRCLDLLTARPDVDPGRLGFVGWSLGATMGARLIGVEPRFKGSVMIAGWASYSHAAQGSHGLFAAAFSGYLEPAARARWLAAIEPLDGTHLLEGNRPMLLQFGARDPIISALDRALYRAKAGVDAETRLYDVGHFELGDGEPRRDRETWLARLLSLPER